jgi:aminopeptidase
MTPHQMATLFRGGLDADYAGLERTADALRDILAHGKEIHLRASNGSDFYAQIAGQEIHTSDGVISSKDQQGGRGQAAAFLPAGEVYVVAVPGSAHGMLAMDHTWYQHKEITGLKATVDGGKVTGFTATRGLESLQTSYQHAGKGKEEVGVIDIGINPAIRPPVGSRVRPWSQAGMVTISIGNNQWAGGDNTGDFGFVFQMTGATMTVDGRTVVDNGKLVISSR